MTNITQHYWVHDFDAVALQLGPLPLRWYGIMYIAGFAAAYWLLLRRQRTGLLMLPSRQAVQDMLFYCFCGVLAGGRLGHCLFYEFPHFVRAPWEILMVWKGGMSSHGGFAGVMIALALFARAYRLSFLHLLDNAVIAAAPGLFFGRLGNFINAELCGRVTRVPWAVIFPAVDYLPRHPVQIYQALAEGALTFALLMLLGCRPRPLGFLSGVFACVYAAGRLVTEPFREPAPVLAGPFGLGLTQGQFLSLFVLIIGVGLLVNCMRSSSRV